MSKENEEEADVPDRKMNDSTMPPPPRVVTTTAATSSSNSMTAAVAALSSVPSTGSPAPRYAASTAATGKKPAVPIRKKGFGLSDWNRLVASSKDLALRRGAPLRQIRWKEIRQHTSLHDGWVVLKNKVYFVSPYLAYHPGGERIVQQVLGKDVTTLYNKYHQWVNEDGLIGKLLIGYLDTSKDESDSDDGEDDDTPTSYLPSAQLS